MYLSDRRTIKTTPSVNHSCRVCPPNFDQRIVATQQSKIYYFMQYRWHNFGSANHLARLNNRKLKASRTSHCNQKTQQSKTKSLTRQTETALLVKLWPNNLSPSTLSQNIFLQVPLQNSYTYLPQLLSKATTSMSTTTAYWAVRPQPQRKNINYQQRLMNHHYERTLGLRNIHWVSWVQLVTRRKGNK